MHGRHERVSRFPMSGFDELIDGYRRFRGGAYLAQKARYDLLKV